jgi:hypothetical protein
VAQGPASTLDKSMTRISCKLVGEVITLISCNQIFARYRECHAITHRLFLAGDLSDRIEALT